MVQSVRACFISAGVIGLSACSSTSNGPAPERPSLTVQDSSFVTFAAESSNSEIAASRVALANSQNTSVKAFATKMIADHTTANGQLAKTTTVLTYYSGITAAPLPAEAQKLASYAGLTGPAFDAAYLADQVQAHQSTIAVFNSEITAGSASDLKGFVTAQLPILNMHLQMAQQLQSTGQ